MGVVEDALQAVGLRQVGGLAQQAERLLAAAVEREGAQPQQLDVQPPLLQLPGPARRPAPAARARGASPAPRSAAWPSASSRSTSTLRRHSRPCGLPASASRASICAHSSRQVSGRKRRACRRTWSVRLATHRRGRRRATPTACSAPSSSSARFSAPSADRDARHRAVAQQHGLGQAAALEHVQPVGQQRRGLGRLVALPHARRPAAPPASQAKGLRRPRSASACASAGRSSLLGQQHLAFPQVAQADDEVAPAAEVAHRRVPRCRCGACCWRSRASAGSPSSSVRKAERLAWILRSSGSRSGGVLGPGVVQFGEAVGVVGEDRGAAEDQRALAAQRVVDARLRQDAGDQAAGLVVALAQRQRPGGGQQQPRPAVHLLGRQTRQPFEHARPAGRASSAIRTGCARPVHRRCRRCPARQAWPRRRLEQAVRRPASRRRARAAVARSAAGKRGEAFAQHVARQAVHAQPFACLRAATKTGVSRARPRQALAGVRRLQQRVSTVRDAGGRGSAMRVRKASVGRIEVGQQQADEMLAECVALAPGTAARPARWSPPLPSADSASCSPSGQPSVSSCRRAAASRSTRSPKRLCTSSRVSSSCRRSCAGPTTAHCP